MADIFNQFEQASTNKNKTTFSSVDMSSSGYINMSLEQDVPIFNKVKKDFTPADKITHVAIASRYLVVAMANGMLFRMDLQKPQEQDEIPVVKHNCRLTNIFLDPTGNHLLITFAPKNPDATAELMYLSRKTNKIKPSAKFRGYEITEVAWNYANESDGTTGPILLGTSKGLIFETEIVLEGDKFFPATFSSGLEQYWKQLFDVGKGTNTPITGLEFFNVPGTDKYSIFAATPSRLYYFTARINPEEKPLLVQVFKYYLNVPEEKTYRSIKTQFSAPSRLKFWSENLFMPNSLAWITEEGVHYAQFDLSKIDCIDDLKTTLIPYPKPLYQDFSKSPKLPFTLILTEFHILLGYTDAIKGVCVLNQEVCYEDSYSETTGKLINLIKDPFTGRIWAITENSIFQFKVTKEDRNVWQIYCDNKQFDLAKKYSRQNEAFYNQVLIKEADMLFENKQYELSAKRYAETQSSFEDICLKFIQIDKQDALKIYLSQKLENLNAQDKTQITMIVLWIIELYLNKLEMERLADMEQSTNFYNIQKEFDGFLEMPRVLDCIKTNKSTIYKLMASHGDTDNMMKFTKLNNDNERLIRQHVYKNNFLEALEVLKNQNNYELFYQFAPILMREVPKFMVKAIKEKGRKLMPINLLPALVSCDGELHAREIISYLEFCVEKLDSKEKAIHNLLLSLYARHDCDKLIKYLDSQGQELLLVNYDVHFAFRLCREMNLTKACVQLSCLLGLWESAVDLALSIDVESAKQVANMPPQSDVELRKKLWLKIAQHIVHGKDDIKQAMKFLQECDLIRIEDILPFFSDFVTIEHFKEAICNSLKDYNQHIQDLKDEMEEATQSAELVRQEIQNFRNRYTYIRSTDCCDICNLTLMIRAFYMFPCKHRFHTDCLLKELNPMLGPAKKSKLSDLYRQLNILNNQAQADNISMGSTGMSARDTVKAEIDNIIGSECLYCGENMIRNIDKTFIDESDYDTVLKEWE